MNVVRSGSHAFAICIRSIMLGGLLVLHPIESIAQSDSAVHHPLFTPGDALLAGGILLSARFVHKLDASYMHRLQDSSTQANRRLQLLAKTMRVTVAPGAYIIGASLYAAGRASKDQKLAELGLHGVEALVVGEMTGTAIKLVTGRARPYVNGNPDDYELGRGFKSGDYKSFPSGHSVAAFAAAAAVTSETSTWAPDQRWIVGPIMFGGAAMVGMSRMYNNQHWASDVIVGAGIGTLAGLKVVRYHHSHPGSGVDRWFLAGSLVPNGDGGRSIRWSLLPSALLGNVPGSGRR
jgi:membrane-associated phospholipid phosphatase